MAIVANMPDGAIRQHIAIEAVQTAFGGWRCYFICPVTARRCEILYYAGGRFASRKAQRLTYATQNMTDLSRTRRRASKLRGRLRGSGGQPRPRGRNRIELAEKVRDAECEATATSRAAIERTPCVPNTPTPKAELVAELRSLADSLTARNMLRAYNTTLNTLGSAKDAKYFIVELDPDNNSVTVRRYKAKESAEANKRYTELESQIPEGSRRQVVLVSVADITALKRAYPNYFLDTALFSRLVDRVLKGEFPDPLPHQTNPGAS